MSQSCHLCKASYSVDTRFNLMRRVGESRRLDCKSLLAEVRIGNGVAVDQLMSVVHADLRRIVRGVMRSEGLRHALKPVAVVNESFWRLIQSRDNLRRSVQLDWQSRAHFLAIASHQIRLVLADHTRREGVGKKLLHLGVLIDSPDLSASGMIVEFLLLEQLLTELAKTDQERVRIVEMCGLGGMTSMEIALVEHSSIAKAKKDFVMAQSYLTKVLWKSGLATRERNSSQSI